MEPPRLNEVLATRFPRMLKASLPDMLGKQLARRDILNGVSVIIKGLNWLFLVEMITVLIVVLFYLFYFSRVLGSFIGTALTWLMLFRRYNVHLEFESIQFSPLGGRISFKDLRYISRNQSLRVQTGHLTLRYWLWRVRDNKADSATKDLPCRVKVEFEGLEWFVYNRTPSYDAIINHLVDQRDAPLAEKSKSSAWRSSKKSMQKETAPLAPLHARLDAWWASFLPVSIVCRTGSIVLGNRATPTILIVGFKMAAGTYCVSESRSACDYYKELYKFKFDEPRAVWRTNPDYDESMLKHGARLHGELSSRSDVDMSTPTNLHYSRFHRLLKGLNAFKLSQISADPIYLHASKSWKGLDRYQETESHDPEYARVNTLLECPSLRMEYYCDAAGPVPDTPVGLAGLEAADIGNGDLSPEWGVTVVIKGGTVNYGPWTDRQRAALQAVFIPPSFFDSEQTPNLMPGETRRHTSMKISIDFSDNAKIRIPTREPSKDWLWDGQLRRHLAPSLTRHYGWLDAYLGGDSSINFALPMVAGPEGFDTLLEVHIDSLSVFCSLAPDAPIIGSEYCRVSVQMPSPLKWCDTRAWTVGITMTKTYIRMLREYANLINDVVTDMLSGPSGDLEHFVPVLYRINILLKDYEISVYLNEHNVVTLPGMENDNTMLHMKGETVGASVDVSSEVHQPDRSQVGFAVKADPLTMGITVPLWNTHAAFRTPRTEDFGSIPELSLDGSFVYHSRYDPNLVDTLYMNIKSRKLVFKTLGWCIRYLINIRDNYFGNYTHRVTAQEFAQQRPRRTQETAADMLHHHQVGDPVEEKYRPGKKNAYEVLLSVDIGDATLIMPDTLYDCKSGLVIFLPDAQIHLRNHDLFMEMTASFDPISAVLLDDIEPSLGMHRPPDETTQKPHLLIDGLDISGHRMFGHQPRASTYMCVWEITAGKINGLLRPEDLEMAGRVGRVMALNLADCDNSLAPEFAVKGDPDCNCFGVRIGALEIVIEGSDDSKILLSTPAGVTVRTNDFPYEHLLSQVEIDIPTIGIKALIPLDSSATHFMDVASLDLDLLVTLGSSRSGWQDYARQKIDFILQEDAATGRCPFIYQSDSHLARATSHIGALFAPEVSQPRAFHVMDRPSVVSAGQSGLLRARSCDIGTAEDSGAESDCSGPSRSGSPATTSLRRETIPIGPHHAYHRVLGDLITGLTSDNDRRRDESAFTNPRSTSNPKLATVGSQDIRTRLMSSFTQSTLPDLDGENTSYVRVDVRRGVFARLTPLAAAHANRFMTASHLNVEHWLDNLHARYVSFRRTPKYKPASVHLALFPTLISVSTFQDVLQAEEPSTPEQTRRASYFTTPPTEILSQIEIDLRDCSILHSMRSTIPCLPTRRVRDDLAYHRLKVVIKEISLKLFHAEEASFPRRRAMERPSRGSLHSMAPTIDLQWSQIKIVADADSTMLRAEADLGVIKIDFADAAAELILGSYVAWQRALHTLLQQVVQSRWSSDYAQRRMFLQLARCLETDPSQPVFLTRGSPLLDWTEGSLRFDRSWQALVNLRQGFLSSPEAYMTAAERSPVVQSSYDPHQMLGEAEVILASWRSWERQDDAIVESELLAHIFGPIAFAEVGAFSLPLGAKVGTARLRLPAVDANLLDTSQAFNGAYMHGIDTSVNLRYTPATDEIAIAAKLVLDDMSVCANPDLLGLVRHIVQVQAVFEQKRAANLAAIKRTAARASPTWHTKKIAPLRPDLRVSVCLELRKAMAKAEAHGVTGIVEITGIRAFADCQLQNDIFAVSVFFGLHLLHVAAVEGVKQLADAPGGPSAESILMSAELLDPQAHLEVDDAYVARKYVGNLERPSATPKISVAINSGRLVLRILQNVLRLHRFFSDWSSQAFPKSRSVLEDLKQDLTFARSPTQRRRATSVGTVNPTRPRWQDITAVSVSVFIESVVIEMQAMPTLRVDYRMSQAYSFGSYRPPPARTAHSRRRSSHALATTFFEVGLSVEQQGIYFLPTSARDQKVLAHASETLSLPAIKVAVHNKDHTLAIVAMLEVVLINLTASVLDSCLAAQQHFGEDLDELLELLNEHRTKVDERKLAANSGSPRMLASARRSIPLWSGMRAQVALRGFKVAIKAPLAIQNVQAELIEANITTSPGEPLFWQVKAADLALSLEQQGPQSASGDLHLHQLERLAYFGIDIHANNRPRAVTNLPPIVGEHRSDSLPLHLHVHLPRVHAVMQPATIDALAELVDHFTVEIRARRANRGKEIQQMRVRFKQTLFASDDAPIASPATIIERLILSVRLDGLGVAIPLVEGGIDAPLELRKVHQRPAFLFSVPSIDFATRKGSAGYASVTNLSLQFVPVFDQHNKRHFSAENHETTTAMILPQMSCTVQPRRMDHEVQHTRVDSSVSGLRLDLDPSIASYVFRLIDVFHLSQARFERLAIAENFEAFGLAGDSKATSSAPTETRIVGRASSSAHRAKTIQTTFEFEYGEIHFHPRPSMAHLRSKHKRTHSVHGTSAPRREPQSAFATVFSASPAQSMSAGGLSSSRPKDPVFILPALSIRSEFRDGHAEQIHDSRCELHLTAVLHGSRNILYPNILPFFDELATDIKMRLRRPASERITSTTSASSGSAGQVAETVTPQPSSRLQLAISLRIDDSCLTFSCQPEAQVWTALEWKSGGFLFTMTPGSRSIGVIVRISEVGIDLQHVFAAGTGARAVAAHLKGLAAAVTLDKPDEMEGEDDHVEKRTLSVTVSAPSLIGDINMRQLHDALSFKSVWLDRLGALSSMGPDTSPPPSASSRRKTSIYMAAPQSTAVGTLLDVIVAARIEEMSLSCDMGLAIGQVKGTSRNMMGRLRLMPRESRSVAVSFDELEAIAAGRLKGSLYLRHTGFSTTLFDQGVAAIQERGQLFSIAFRLGDLRIAFDYDFRRIFLGETEPIFVLVTDNWRDVGKDGLKLNFRVQAGAFTMFATAQSIPTTIGLFQEVERLFESAEQRAREQLKSHQQRPKRDAVGAIARLRAESGQTPSGEQSAAMSGSGMRIFAALQLEVGKLCLVVFPAHFSDSTVWRIDLTSIGASLSRGLEDGNQIKRILSLTLVAATANKLTPRKLSVAEERDLNLDSWLKQLENRSVTGEANIVKVPAINVSMSSWQAEGSARVEHVYKLHWSSGVVITLNVGLLKETKNLVVDVMQRVTTAIARRKTGRNEPDFEAAPLSLPKIRAPVYEPGTDGHGGSTAVVMATTPLLASGSHAPPVLIFIEREPAQIEHPRLQTLGDATPPVMRSVMARAPAATHSFVVSSLESLLLLLTETYEMQLAARGGEAFYTARTT